MTGRSTEIARLEKQIEQLRAEEAGHVVMNRLLRGQTPEEPATPSSEGSADLGTRPPVPPVAEQDMNALIRRAAGVEPFPSGDQVQQQASGLSFTEYNQRKESEQ